MRRASLLFCLLLLVLSSLGQDMQKPYGVGVRTYYGFLVPHRPVMRHLAQSHLPGIELYLEKHTDGSELYHRLHHRPSYGVGLYYTDLGNEQLLGKAVALFPYLNFPLLGGGYNFHWKFRVSSGLGYITQPFDQATNHKNVAIGSNFNALVGLMTEIDWHRDPVSFNAGLSVTHFSNGAALSPNLGLNIPGVHVGLRLDIGQATPIDTSIMFSAWDPHRSWNVLASMGYKQTGAPGGKTYLAYTMSLIHRRDYAMKSALTYSLDLFYNESLRFRYREDIGPLPSDLSILQVGANIGYTLKISRFEILIHQGIYLYDNYRLQGLLYNRIGYRYRINDHLTAITRLKAHLTKADYLEYGFSYKF